MKPTTIIGGGLAGLTLGIALRRREVPVTIIEAGHYPRHRVCGEFISGLGQDVIADLGLTEVLMQCGARFARSAAFFTEGSRTCGKRSCGNGVSRAKQKSQDFLGRSNLSCFSRELPHPALCLSRFALDHALSSTFRELGGELREGERWRDRTFGEGVVCANGRRAHATENGWRWFGLKVHARAVSLEADLEMHFGRDFYVGLCRLQNGVVNVCGLFRRRTNEASRGESLDWLRGYPGSCLRERLEHAEFDPHSFCAVAGLSLRRQEIDPHECRIGDAITMIPPITGNGMSIAFESAKLAAEPLTRYSRGDNWSDITNEIAQRLGEALTSRLRWAGLLHRLLFARSGRAFVLSMALRSNWIWHRAFALTR